MLVLRNARESDDHALGAIDHAGWSPTTDPGDRWAVDRPFFGEPTGTRIEDVIVATEDEVPVGFVKIRQEQSAFGAWTIAGLGVATEQRRRGIGRLLVRAALARAASASATSVWLKVLSSNEPAVRLYESCGFEEMARYRERFSLDRRLVDELRLVVTLH